MSRTPAQIEQVLRMMLAGKSHGEISAELYPESESRISNNVWHRFKTNTVLHETYGGDKGHLNTEALLKDLAAKGYTLTVLEINQLFSLARGGLAAKPKKGPPNAAQRRWGSGTGMGTAPTAEAPREVGRPSAGKPQDPLPIDFTSDWLSREGIPYAEAGEYGCTQPVGSIPGNVCGEQMPPARVEQRGLTTCSKCHEATRQGGVTAAKGLKLPSIAYR